jgi:cardiolipin synthase (CMP-forming)
LQRKEKILNVPNILSAYRLLASPVILYMILTGNRELFFVLLCINLVTDIADGLIARAFNLQTEFGAKLDSYADIGTYILGITGMIVIEHDFVSEHLMPLSIVVGMYIIPILASLLRFKKTPHLHLYSSKITAYIQGIFFLIYFIDGYVAWYFNLMILISCFSYVEELIIVLYIPAMRSNMKGVWLLWTKNK